MNSPEADARSISWPHVIVTVVIVAGAYFAFRGLTRAEIPGLTAPVVKLLLWIPIPLAAATLLGRPSIANPLAGVGLKPPYLLAVVPAVVAGAVEVAYFAYHGYTPVIPAIQVVFAGVLVAAITEEFLFRGYALTQLVSAGLPARAAIVIGGVLFGAAHVPNLWGSGDIGTIWARGRHHRPRRHLVCDSDDADERISGCRNRTTSHAQFGLGSVRDCARCHRQQGRPHCAAGGERSGNPVRGTSQVAQSPANAGRCMSAMTSTPSERAGRAIIWTMSRRRQPDALNGFRRRPTVRTQSDGTTRTVARSTEALGKRLTILE